ncbi:MAG TPA: hypothetical protein VIV60_17630 [Polyangiaceae bacterium]
MSLSNPQTSHPILDTMSSDMKDESSGVVSGIPNAEEQGSHAAASVTHSGIANLGNKQAREQIKPVRPLPVPPRPAADITRQRVARIAAHETDESPNIGTRSKPAPNTLSSNVRERTTSPPPAKQGHMDSDSDGSASRDSERTTIFRPNLKDPKLRSSLPPTVPPAHGQAAASAPTPAPNAAIQAKATLQTPVEEQEQDLGNESWEEHTHAYAPDVIDKLLNVERPTMRPSTCAADEATCVGELPIEALVLAQRKAPTKGIGFDDETGVYSLLAGSERADLTSPGTRPKIASPGLPSIVIRDDEQPRRKRLPWLAIAGCLALLAAGWHYRAGIGAEFHKAQSRLVRGLEGTKPVAVRPAPAPVASTVTIAISVSPADARLSLDDVQVTNPCSIQRRADTQPHTLVAEAKGFATLHRTVHFESDLTIVLALAPLPPAAPVASAEVTAAPTATQHNSPRAASVRSVRSVVAKSKSADPPATTAATVEQAARSDCDPPYTLDEAGIKVYKAGCL